MDKRRNAAACTIKEVAACAGVTPAIVSRVCNGDKTLTIKEETRQAVLEAIRKLNYQPNSIARSLRTKRNRTFGVIITDIMNPFFTEVIKGIQIAANEAGYRIILCDTEENPEKEKQYIEDLSAQQVDGIILGSSYLENEVVEVLDACGTKYVLLNRATSHSSAPYVGTDDTTGMMRAVEHLVSLGHSRVAHIAGPLYTDTALRRLEGYRKGLREAHLGYNPQYVMEARYDEQSGYEVCRRLLEACSPRPTAICCCNDLVAIGALRALKELGLTVPGDISVVGYNDIWVSSLLSPPLTTIRPPLLEMGRTAFELLLALVQGEPHQKRVRLETHLVVRQSTAPLRR